METAPTPPKKDDSSRELLEIRTELEKTRRLIGRLNESITTLQEKGTAITTNQQLILERKQQELQEATQKLASLEKRESDLGQTAEPSPENNDRADIDEALAAGRSFLTKLRESPDQKSEGPTVIARLLKYVKQDPDAIKPMVNDIRALIQVEPEDKPAGEKKAGKKEGADKNPKTGKDVGKPADRAAAHSEKNKKWTDDVKKLRDRFLDQKGENRRAPNIDAWVRLLSINKLNELSYKKTDTSETVDFKIKSVALAVETLEAVIGSVHSAAMDRGDKDLKTAQRALSEWKIVLTILTDFRDKREKTKDADAKTAEIEEKKRLKKEAFEKIKPVGSSINGLESALNNIKFILRSRKDAQEQIDAAASRGETSDIKKKEIPLQDIDSIVVITTGYNEFLSIPDIVTYIESWDEEQKDHLYSALTYLHDNITLLEVLFDDNEAFGPKADEFKTGLTTLRTRLEELKLTRKDLKERELIEKAAREEKIRKKKEAKSGKSHATTAGGDDIPKKHADSANTPDTPPATPRTVKTLAELQAVLENTTDPVVRSLREDKFFDELLLSLVSPEDTKKETLETTGFSNLLRSARKQLLDLRVLLPVGVEVAVGDLSMIKDNVLDKINPLYEILNKIPETEKTAEIKSLTKMIETLAPRLKITLARKKPEADLKKKFEDAIENENSTYVKKAVKTLEKTVTLLNLGGTPNNTDLEKLAKEIPDELDDSKREILKKALETLVQKLLTTEIKDASARSAIINIAVKLGIEKPAEKKSETLYTKQGHKYVFDDEKDFLAEVAKGDTSEFLADVKLLATHVGEQIKHGTVTQETLNEWEGLYNSIPRTRSKAECKNLIDILETPVLSAISKISTKEGGTELKLRKILAQLCIKLNIDIPEETPEPIDTPEITVVKQTLRREDILTDDTWKAEYGVKTPGFKQWVETAYINKLQVMFFADSLPDEYKKTLAELHRAYEPHAKTIEALSKALENDDIINTDMYEDFVIRARIPAVADNKIIKQELLNNIVFSIFNGNYSHEYEAQVQNILEQSQKIKEAQEKIVELEAALTKEQTRLAEISDPAKDLTQTEYDKGIKNLDLPDVEKDLDTFLDTVYKEYEALKGGLKSDRSGFVTSLYKRWRMRDEAIASGKTKPLGFFGRTLIKTLVWAEDLWSKHGSMDTADYVEVNKLERKLKILRDHRLLPEKESNVSKEQAEANRNKLAKYIAAKRYDNLSSLDANTIRYAEPIYNELFTTIAQEKYPFTDTASRDNIKTKIVDSQQSVVDSLQDDVEEQNTEIADARSSVGNPLNLSHPEQETLSNSLKQKEVEALVKIIGDRDEPLDASRLNALIKSTPRVFKVYFDSETPVGKKREAVAAKVVTLLRRYLEGRRLFDTPYETLRKIYDPLRDSLAIALESNSLTKAKKQEAVAQLQKILGEYKAKFTERGEMDGINLTNVIIANIDDMKRLIS